MGGPASLAFSLKTEVCLSALGGGLSASNVRHVKNNPLSPDPTLRHLCDGETLFDPLQGGLCLYKEVHSWLRHRSEVYTSRAFF